MFILHFVQPSIPVVKTLLKFACCTEKLKKDTIKYGMSLKFNKTNKDQIFQKSLITNS